MSVLDTIKLIDNRVNAIRAFHKKAGVPKAELDLSGGIDSAVMAVLLKMALGTENVILVHSQFHTASEQTDRAVRLAKQLGVRLVNSDFGETYEVLLDRIFQDMIAAGIGIDEMEKRILDDPTIEGSIRACLRAPIGRAVNRLFGGGIRHGTGNECEDRFLRFYQKGGDGEVDTNPMAMLTKVEVFQLAYGLAIGERHEDDLQEVLFDTIKALPSPDLWGNGDGHSDEAELLSQFKVPLTYGRIELHTGSITSFGTIERVSRFIDWVGRRIFDCSPIDDQKVWNATDAQWQSIFFLTQGSHFFQGMRTREAVPLLRAARIAEAQTRHKWNPNIPTLGTRHELVSEGILSDDLTLKED